MPRIQILLVDDSPASLLTLEAVLDSPDYDLVKVHSGAKAIELIERGDKFAAILLDVHMPVIDGYETAKRIKQLPNGRDIPLIFVTAIYRDDDDAIQGYQVGALDYLAKPLIPDVVKAKVRIYADLFQKREALRRLENDHARLSAIVESSEDAILSVDRTGHIMTWNAGAERMFGYTAAEIVGKPASVLAPPAKVLEQRKLMALLLRGERVSNFETLRQRKGGQQIRVSISDSPLVNGNGEVIGVGAIVRDMTGRQAPERIAASEPMAPAALPAATVNDLRPPLSTLASHLKALEGHLAKLTRFARASAPPAVVGARPHRGSDRIWEEIDAIFVLEDWPKAIAESRRASERLRDLVLGKGL